jgi:hypothetical protein
VLNKEHDLPEKHERLPLFIQEGVCLISSEREEQLAAGVAQGAPVK